MEYTAESLIPVMAHIAKNVVKVNEGLTKHMVSAPKAGFSLTILTDASGHRGSNLVHVFTPVNQSLHFDLHTLLLQAIKGKYSTSKQMKIAAISQLKSSVVKDFAKQAA